MALVAFDSVERVRSLKESGWLNPDRYEDASSLDLLDYTLSLAQANALPLNHPDRRDYINRIAHLHVKRFQFTGSVELIDHAIDISKSENPSEDPSARAVYLSTLAFWYSKRFECLESTEDIENTVRYYREATEVLEKGHPHRPYYLSWYASWQGRQATSVKAIDDAIRHMKASMDALPVNNCDRVTWLYEMGVLYEKRFSYTREVQDLDNAIQGVQQVIYASAPEDHVTKNSYRVKMSAWLQARFDHTGSIDDITRQIDLLKLVVDTTDKTHPERGHRLYRLGFSFGKRYEVHKSMDDLKNAIHYSQEALHASPFNLMDRAHQLSNVGIWLGKVFEYNGEIESLDQAIDMSTRAVDTLPKDHISRANLLKNLGMLVRRRFEALGSMGDLNHAINLARLSVELTRPNNPSLSSRLNSLAIRLGKRFEHTGIMADLDSAIEIAKKAIAAIPPNTFNRAPFLNSLALRLGLRFKRTGVRDDLDSAIELAKTAVDITPAEHSYKANYLKVLAEHLSIRFDQTGSIEDLKSAIEFAEMSLKITPSTQSTRASYLNVLARLLGNYSEKLKSADGLDRALSLYRESWNHANAPLTERIQAAQRAAAIFADRSDWKQASLLLKDAVMLLPNISPGHLQHSDKQYMLTEFAGLACRAAAVALQEGKEAYEALRLLELGRGVISSFLLDIRMDITDLKHDHPDLADELTSLRDELDAPMEAETEATTPIKASAWESKGKRRRELDSRLSELITRIRGQPGYENFQDAPTAQELMHAADPDPIVIINVSPYRCDAFLIQKQDITVLPLPDLHLHDIQVRVQDLRLNRCTTSPTYVSRLLEWMWDLIACPILNALGFTSLPPKDGWPHIWWIPTGPLSDLPIHAAGHHRKNSTSTVLDRVVSSYSSSAKALIYGRRRPRRPPSPSRARNAVLLAMDSTPGLSAIHDLPFAAKEIQIVHELCPSLGITPVHPKPHKSDTLAHLRACTLFHFAGHGRSDPAEPSRSSLLLTDWETDPLTVASLRELRLVRHQDKPEEKEGPFLAYLSACSTGANEMEELVDEGIHLTSALQLAGFRHVIGTLWEVSDEHSADVARVVYETLRDEGMSDWTVPRSLHRSVRALRDRDLDKNQDRGGMLERDAKLITSNSNPGEWTGIDSNVVNFHWVPYVHFGV